MTAILHQSVLSLLLLTFAAGSAVGETEVKSEDGNSAGLGLNLSVEFSSSGSTNWHPSASAQGKAGTTEQTYTVSQSLFSGAENTLVASVDYHQTDFDFEGDGSRPLLPDRLVAATVSALYIRQLNTAWAGGLLIETGSYAAGRKGKMSTGGWSASLGAIARYRVNPALSVKLGVVYQSLAEGSDRWSPAVGVEWKISDACRFAVGYPRTGLTYQLTDRLSLAAVARGNFETYRIKDEPKGSSGPTLGLRGEKLSYTEITASFEVEYTCTPRLTLRASIGAVLQRTVNYHSRSLKLESQHTPPVGTVGLEWSL